MTLDAIAVEQLYMDVHSLTHWVGHVAVALRVYGEIRSVPRTPIHQQSNFRRLPDGSETHDVRVFTEAESAAVYDNSLRTAAEYVADCVIQFDADWRRIRPRLWNMVALARAEYNTESRPCRIGLVSETTYLEVAADIFGTISMKLANIPHDHDITQPPGFRDALLISWSQFGTLEYETLVLIFDDLKEKTVQNAMADLCVHLKRERLAIQKSLIPAAPPPPRAADSPDSVTPASRTKSASRISQGERKLALEASRQYLVGKNRLVQQGKLDPSVRAVFVVLTRMLTTPDEVPGKLKNWHRWRKLVGYAKVLGYLDHAPD